MATCDLERGDSIDVITLVDQSRSLAPRMGSSQDAPRSDAVLKELSEGVELIEETLLRLTKGSGNLDVHLGVIEFSSRIDESRQLSPLTKEGELDSLRNGLQNTEDLGAGTDFVAALRSAYEMFDRSTSGADCRILIWFTDGVVEPMPRSSEEYDFFNPDYVSRVRNDLIDSVCGNAGTVGLADDFRLLDIKTYALMINEKVGEWLDISSADSNSRASSVAVRFRASIDAMRSITGDRSPELGNAPIPEIDQSCERFLEDRQSGLSGSGKLFTSQTNLKEYIFLAVGLIGDPRPIGPCPNEIPASSMPWESESLPPGAKFEQISVTILDGELEDSSSVIARTASKDTRIRLDDGFLDESDLKAIDEEWRIVLQSSKSSDGRFQDLKVCILPTIKGLVTTMVPLTPQNDSLIDDGVAIGEDTVIFDIDWSPLERNDGLIFSEYIGAVEASSPIGDVTISSDFLTATLVVTSPPDSSAAASETQFIEQIDITVIPRSDYELPNNKIQGIVDPPLRLRNNENAPAIQCSGEPRVTALNETSDGRTIESKLICLVSPPKSGVATLTFSSPPSSGGNSPEDQVRWGPVDADGRGLPEIITIEPESPEISVTFSTQELTKDKSWLANFTEENSGSLTLTWSENRMKESATFELLISLKEVPRPWWFRFWVITFFIASALLSLGTLWLISWFLVKLPDGSRVNYKATTITIPRDKRERLSNVLKIVEDALADERSRRCSRTQQRSSLTVSSSVKLERRIPIFPPFKTPEVRIISSALRSVGLPSGPSNGSLSSSFTTALVISVPNRNFSRPDQSDLTLELLVLFPIGTDYREWLTDQRKGLENQLGELRDFVSEKDESTQETPAKDPLSTAKTPRTGSRRGRRAQAPTSNQTSELSSGSTRAARDRQSTDGRERNRRPNR